MPSRLALCLVVAVAAMASAGTLLGQETLMDPNVATLARFSYQGGRISPTNANFCFAVEPSGNYRIQRWNGTADNPTLAGKLSRQQVRQLDELLSDPGFRAPRNHDSNPGLVTKDSETFIAQLSGEPPAKSNNDRYMVWANRDGRTPFPAAVTRVIRWISQLGVKDVKP